MQDRWMLEHSQHQWVAIVGSGQSYDISMHIVYQMPRIRFIVNERCAFVISVIEHTTSVAYLLKSFGFPKPLRSEGVVQSIRDCDFGLWQKKKTIKLRSYSSTHFSPTLARSAKLTCALLRRKRPGNHLWGNNKVALVVPKKCRPYSQLL